MKVLVGSTALAHHISGIREPKDVDYLTDEELDGNDDIYSDARFGGFDWSGDIASLDELYTIKISHSFWALKNGSWDKHMFDLVTMKDSGAQLIPELYGLLYPIWEERYGKKKANLEQKPDDFFNPNIDRKYDHDSVHASIAYYDEPLFNRILRDDHDIAVDKAKFDVLSNEDKFRLVREEIYATALERRLIPSNYAVNQRGAYAYALRKTIVDFTKGWFPLFIVDNFGELRSPDIDFVKRHHANAHLLIPLSG